MTLFHSRPYNGRADIPSLLVFASKSGASRPPGFATWHPGDITWQFFNQAPTEDIRIWEDAGGVVAMGAFEWPLVFSYDLLPGLPEDGLLAREILDWALERRRAGGHPTTIPHAYASLPTDSLAVMPGHNAARIAFLESRGFTRHDLHGLRFQLTLDTLSSTPELPPPGTRLRHTTASDVDARVDLHRDAWSVWGPPSATVESYRELRAAPNFDEELDIVLEAADGSLVSYCICWADPATGVGLFEPVGTRPSHARRGYGRAVIREGLRRLRARGMHTAIVSTAGINTAAAALYPSAGFTLASRDHYWTSPTR